MTPSACLPGNRTPGFQIPQRSRAVRGAWLAGAEAIHNPSLAWRTLPGVVAANRESGILTPATAMIVVESDSQWKILQEREKRKLRGKAGLEHRDAPEPSVWLLAACLAALFSVTAIRKRRFGSFHASHWPQTRNGPA